MFVVLNAAVSDSGHRGGGAQKNRNFLRNKSVFVLKFPPLPVMETWDDIEVSRSSG